MNNVLNNSVALVIGGNGGIGYSVTERLLKDGFYVCSTYHKNQENLELLKKSNEENFFSYKCDVRLEPKVKRVIDDILLRLNRIDVVIFSVSSPLKNTRILDLEWNDYFDHIELQIKTILFVVKSLKDQIFQKNKIRFIVILSESSIGTPPKGLSHYVTAKYAAMGMTKTMAAELAQYNCNFNMISPGMVDTDLLNTFPPKLIEMTAYQNPMKRIAKSEDVSNVVSFLASNESDYLNGVHINVNGGGIMF